MARTLPERMMGAARLDVSVYEEVEADESATGQAAMVVLIVAICSAIGAYRDGTGGIVTAIVGAFVGWGIWSGVTYVVGTRMFGGTATWGELLRTLGFAQSPGVFGVLAFLPGVGGIVRFAVGVWTLVAGIIAIRQALDVDTGKAVVVAIVAVLLIIAVFIGMAMLFGGAMVLGAALAS